MTALVGYRAGCKMDTLNTIDEQWASPTAGPFKLTGSSMDGFRRSRTLEHTRARAPTGKWPVAASTFDAPPTKFPLRRTFSDSRISRKVKRDSKTRDKTRDRQRSTSPKLSRRGSLTRARKRSVPYTSTSAPVTPRATSPVSGTDESFKPDTTSILSEAARLVSLAHQKKAGALAAARVEPTAVSGSPSLVEAGGGRCKAIAAGQYTAEVFQFSHPHLFSTLGAAAEVPEMAPCVETFLSSMGSAAQSCSLVLHGECKNALLEVPPIPTELRPLANPTLAALHQLRHLGIDGRIVVISIGNDVASDARATAATDSSTFCFNITCNAEAIPESTHNTIELPLRCDDGPVGDSDLLATIRSIVAPIAGYLSPSLCLVLTDCFDDQGQDTKISSIGVATAIQCLMALAEGKCVVASTSVQEQSVYSTAILHALLGEDLPDVPFPNEKPLAATVNSLSSVIASCQQWTVLSTTKFYLPLSPAEFCEERSRNDDDTILATAALASLSMIGH